MQLIHQLSWPLLLLLLLSAARSSYIPRDDGKEPDGVQRATEKRNCAVGARSSTVEALNEMFTCQLDSRIKGTRPYVSAFTIDFGRQAGSGVVQPPLLRGVYRVRDLKGESESFRRFFDVLPAFTVELGQNETRGPAEMALIDSYERHLETSSFIVETFQTLRANGELSGVGSVRDFVRGVMRDQWFKLYGRSAKNHARGLRQSSGFGHVLVGETRSSGVTGFHSWLQILASEEQNTFQYKGHFKVNRQSLVTATIQFNWWGKSKPISSFWFGTPPDFELAVFTASYVVSPGRKARFTIQGENVAVQTYRVNHQPESVATAYPAL